MDNILCNKTPGESESFVIEASHPNELESDTS